MSFKYSPLNRERAEIRVLRLLHSVEGCSPIVCELEHISLDDDIHYEALSYTWGSDVKTDSITLAGTVFPVTSNLFAALRALRQEHSNRCLWIDAVCINQDDVFERNQEVLRMLRIYQRAERVVAWLGEAGEDSTLAVNHLLGLKDDWNYERDRKMMARMIRLSNGAVIHAAAGLGAIIGTARSRPVLTTWAAAYCARLIPATTGLASRASRIITLWSFLALGLRLLKIYRFAVKQVVEKKLVPDATTVKALEGVFTRDWFRRVWIVQEIAAGRDAILLCGKDSISWRDLCKACDQIERLITRSSTTNPYIDSQFRRCSGAREAFNPNKPSSEKEQLKWNLLFLLTHFSIYGATNPRDKVYGLLGLASEAQKQDEEAEMMVPDYNKPLSKIYAETVRFVVMRAGRLDILRACEGFHRMPGLPSWAPDWTCNVFRNVKPIKMQTKPYKLSSDPFPAQPVARFLDVPLTMIVRGFIIGHLVDSGRTLFTLPDRTKGRQFQGVRGGFIDFLLKYVIPNLGLIVKSGIIGFCAKSTLRLFIKLYPELNAPLTPYFGLIDDIANEFTATPTNDGGDADEGTPQLMENILGPGDAEADETTLRSVDWKTILKMPTMNPGHCHTYTPNPQPGDLVCMFIGAAEPYIARKDGDHYLLFCSATFGPFNRFLWKDCEREHQEGTLMLQDFKFR